MTKYTYKNIIEILEKEFPDNKKYEDYRSLQKYGNEKLAYTYCGSLYSYLTEIIEKDPDDINVKKIFDLLNDIFSKTEDEDVEDLFKIEFFGRWIEESVAVNRLAKNNLRGMALEKFNLVLSSYPKKRKLNYLKNYEMLSVVEIA